MTTDDGKVLKSMSPKVHVNNMGYKCFNITRKDGTRTLYLLHRAIAEAFVDGFSRELQVDHINGDTCDNRIENLRMVTQLMNNRSFARKRKGASSIYRGVTYAPRYRNKWHANIRVDGKTIHLGHYNTEEEAAVAFNKAAIENGFNAEALNRIY